MYTKTIFRFLLVAALLVMSGCKERSNMFHLTGEVVGLKDTTVSLFGLFSQPDSLIEIPVEEGRFSYSVELDTITPMSLLIGGTDVPLFADKGLAIRVEGDVAHIDSLQVSGGRVQEEYNAFKHSIASLRGEAERRAVADSFITAHLQSVVSIYLIKEFFVNAPQGKKESVSSAIKKLSGIMQDHPYVSRLLGDMNDSRQKNMRDQYLYLRDLPDSTGRAMVPADYQKQFIVLTLWASWHPESKAQVKSMATLAKKFAKRSVKFVTLSLDSNRAQWVEAIRQDTLPGIHLCDFKGWNGDFVQECGVMGLPATFVMNTASKVIATNLQGEKLEEFLDGKVKSWEATQKKFSRISPKRK